MRDVKNGSEYIGKKGNPICNDFKKARIIFLKIRKTFYIIWGGIISQCSLHQVKGGGCIGSKLRVFSSFMEE